MAGTVGPLQTFFTPLLLPFLLLLPLLLLLLPLPGTQAQVDRTREIGGSGSAMVEAVLAILHDACVYPEDQLLLRRIAYVETHDGTDPSTYGTPGYDGGIWKVDQTMFQRTKTESTRLSHQYALIRSKLGIDWSRVTWADMRRPLYSALAAAMLLMLEGAPTNVPVSVDMQADYWLTHYHKGQATHTAQDFVNPAKSLQKTCARTEKMDVAFLVDTSSSVGPSQWVALKQFVADIVISLSLHSGLGPDKDRVAMVTFSDQATVSFGFDEGVDLRSTMGKISHAPFIPGGTNFTAVLIAARTQIFPKARPEAAKVAVLVSDGKDRNQASMVVELMPLKFSDITFFTVGVGRAAGDQELEEMATAPVCSHAFRVDSHQELSDLHMAIERISCRVPVVLGPGDYSYPCGFNVLAQLQGGSLGTSITVSTDYGSVEVYGSYTTQLPSEDVHDLKETATANAPSVIFARDPRPLTFSLQSERAHALLCNGNFSVRVEKQAAKRTDCNKRKPDLVFLLDSTLAHTDADWAAMLGFVEAFSQQFDVSSAGAHVALVSFADTPVLHFPLGQLGSNADLLQTLRTIQRPQGSNPSSPDLRAALEFVHSRVFPSARGDSSKTLVLVTPGTPNDPVKTVTQTAALHSSGVRIVIAAVGVIFDDVSLNLMASGPHHVQKVADVNALTSDVNDVVKEACGEVKVLCMENGISRECNIEDIINSQYANLLKPDRDVGVNPCAMQIPAGGVHLQKFPHPTQPDKFLLCDSSGQAYVVLCPLGQLYDARKHECRKAPAGSTTPSTPQPRPHISPKATTTTAPPTTTTTAPTTPLPLSSSSSSTPRHPYVPQTTQQHPTASGHLGNPCTADAIIKGLLFHPYPSDPTKYFHCGPMPYSGQLESCPVGKTWYQAITQCIFKNVIVDAATNQVDPTIPNPCGGGSGYFPWPKDPNSYIQCNSYHEAYLMHCPAWEVWKDGQQACGFP